MAHPPEASPPKENSTTWPGRLEGAFEVNTSSAGLGRALLTQHQMPNVLHVHHLLPLLTWAIGDLLCGTSAPSRARRAGIQHLQPTTLHVKAASCMFKRPYSWVSSLTNLQQVIPLDHLSLDMWVLHASQHSLCLPFKLYSSGLFSGEIPQINH